VLYTNADVVISYGSKSAYFADQIVVTQDNWSFASPGDSGSAVDKNGKFVGLLFAGSAGYVVICKAKYIIDGLNITVEPPEGSLTISSTPGGNVTKPAKGLFLYDIGTVVELVAEPDAHYHFVKWTGNVSTIANVTAPSTNITMNDSYSITANFELDEGWYTLTVSSTPGGDVTEPGVGTHVYSNSTVVNLTVVPDKGYQFVRWDGNTTTIANSTAPSTDITMNDCYSITANFALLPGWYSLTVSSTPGGNVTEPGAGTHVYINSTVVNLMAVPDTDYEFVEWTGDVSTIGNVSAAETTITMNGSYYITANFGLWQPEPRWLLTVYTKGDGSVTTPGEGTFLYPLGAKVLLVAVPDEGEHFVKWSGDVSTIDNVIAPSTTITMDSSYSIRADFSGAGWCFIATAAYGTPMAGEVQTLRDFRDEYLVTNPVGQALLDVYYRVSPPIAEFITEHPSLKPIVRAGLVPAVAMSTVAVNTSPAEKIAIIGLLALVSIAIAIWAIRRRARDSEHI